MKICIAPAPHREDLTPKAFRYGSGSHSFYPANTPYMPLFHYSQAFTRRRHHWLVVAAIWLQLTTHLSTPWGWVGLVSWVSVRFTHMNGYWLPINCRSGASRKAALQNTKQFQTRDERKAPVCPVSAEVGEHKRAVPTILWVYWLAIRQHSVSRFLTVAVSV